MADECRVCGQPIENAPQGPRRLYCGGRCRQRALRIRRGESVTTAQLPVLPTRRPPVAESILDLAAAPADVQLAGALAAAREVRHTMARIAPRLPPQLAWRSTETAQQLQATLQQVWGIRG